MSVFFKAYKFTLLILIFSISSIANASEVERVRNVANAKPFVEENKTATDLAQDFLLDADVTEGWNEDKGFFISIGTSVFPESDPATNPDFLNIRALKSFEANISAKGDIISYIRTNMSVQDIVLSLIHI